MKQVNESDDLKILLRRWLAHDTYEQLRVFYRQQYAEYQNRKMNLCVYCRRVPDNATSYFCGQCCIKVGCRDCCQAKYVAGVRCPLCDAKNW